MLTSFGLRLPTEKSKNGLLGSSVLLATDIVNQQAADNQDDVKFSMDDAEQSSFDKTAKRLGGKKAYQKAFDKGDTRKRTAILDYRKASIAVGFYVRCCP